MKDSLDYSRKLIKEAGFKDLKVVNFSKFTLTFLALISVCCMAWIVKVTQRTTDSRPFDMILMSV